MFPGIALVSRFDVDCWNCGNGIVTGDSIYQGNDDHNYCNPCADDIATLYDAPDATCSACDSECNGH